MCAIRLMGITLDFLKTLLQLTVLAELLDEHLMIYS